MDKEIVVELAAVKDNDDKEALQTAATRRVQDKWVQKMGKLLAIVNPALGPSWLDAVTRADFDTKTLRLSIEKLLDMVKAKVPNDIRDRWVHWMSSGSAIHSTYGIPKGDKSFKDWIKKEVWLEHLVEKSCEVFTETSATYQLQIQIPHGADLESWFRAFKLKNRANMFKPYHKHMSATTAPVSSYEIDRSSRRVAYRYYKHILSEIFLANLPTELECWKSTDENSMYSKKGNLDRPGGLSDYEAQNCPPLSEEEEYKANVKVSKLKSKVDSCETMKRSLDAPIDKRDVKRKRKNQEKSQASATAAIDLDLSEATLEEDVQHFDIAKVFTNSSLELHCGDILRTYEQYSKKVEAPVFQNVRDFAKRNARKLHEYKRGGTVRDWEFELIIINFPTNTMSCGEDFEIPPWNVCNTFVIQASFSFGTLCLDDDGWLVSISSVEQARIVEKEASCKMLGAL